jgi:hypothetical protein
MKKVILIFLFAISDLLCGGVFDIKTHVYTQVPAWRCTKNKLIQSMMCAAWAAKFTAYTVERYDYPEKIVVVAFNNYCEFHLQYYESDGRCEIQFRADDDSFDYINFKNIMDIYFLYNEDISVGYCD